MRGGGSVMFNIGDVVMYSAHGVSKIDNKTI